MSKNQYLFTAKSSGTTETLRSVWGTDGSRIFAVGDKGTVLYYDGTTWVPFKFPFPGPAASDGDAEVDSAGWVAKPDFWRIRGNGEKAVLFASDGSLWDLVEGENAEYADQKDAPTFLKNPFLRAPQRRQDRLRPTRRSLAPRRQRFGRRRLRRSGRQPRGWRHAEPLSQSRRRRQRPGRERPLRLRRCQRFGRHGDEPLRRLSQRPEPASQQRQRRLDLLRRLKNRRRYRRDLALRRWQRLLLPGSHHGARLGRTVRRAGRRGHLEPAPKTGRGLCRQFLLRRGRLHRALQNQPGAGQ